MRDKQLREKVSILHEDIFKLQNSINEQKNIINALFKFMSLKYEINAIFGGFQYEMQCEIKKICDTCKK